MSLRVRSDNFLAPASDRDFRSSLANVLWFIRRDCSANLDYHPFEQVLDDVLQAGKALAEQRGIRLNIQLGFEVPSELYVNRESLLQGVLAIVNKIDLLQRDRLNDVTLTVELDIYPRSFVVLFSVYMDETNHPKRAGPYSGSTDVLQRVLELNFILRNRERLIN